MTIEPRIVEFMTPAMIAQAPYLDPACGLSPAERRAHLAANHIAHFSQLDYPSFPDVTTSELTVPGPGGPISLRLFYPEGAGPWPAYLYFFGGSFWQSSFDGPDNVSACRQTASEARVVVAEIDYPLAPEHPYPAALEAGTTALAYLAEHASELRIRPDRLAVGGQSSGANLAAAVALWTRDHGGPALSYQILEVPALDLTGSHLRLEAPAADENSGETNDGGAMAELLAFYGVIDCLTTPYVSPLLAPDLSGLPPTFILAAEHDPLAGDAAAYAQALQAARVDVVQVTYAGQIHASPALSPLTASAAAWRSQVSQALMALHRVPDGVPLEHPWKFERQLLSLG